MKKTLEAETNEFARYIASEQKIPDDLPARLADSVLAEFGFSGPLRLAMLLTLVQGFRELARLEFEQEND